MDVFKLFRALIGASFVLFFLTMGLVFVEPELPDEVVNFIAEHSVDPVEGMLLAESGALWVIGAAFLVVYLGAYLASLAGMLSYKPWARTVYIVTTGISVLMMPLAGATFSFRWQSTADALYWLADGALLVLLFTDPVRSRFAARAAI